MCDISVLSPVLVKEAENITGIKNAKEAVEFILRKYIESIDRIQLLKYQGKNIWEGNLEKMREIF